MPAEACFRVMGSAAHVVVRGPSSLLASARRRLDDLEQKWSRFLPASEVSRLNAHADRLLRVSAETVLLVQRAVQGWRGTNGWFNPLLLEAVCTAGYDRSFERVEAACGDRSWGTRAPQVPSPDLIEIDPGGSVRLPAGSGFDPGGLGKGLAADLVAAELAAAGAEGACVNVGGDLRVIGEAPGGRGWLIDLAEALVNGTDAPGERLVMAAGAVATSSRLRRRWSVAGEERHHLIDPTTGASARSNVLAVTVVSAEAWQAEVLAKAAFLGGDDGVALIERLAGAALITHTGGRTTTVGPWTAFTPLVATGRR